MARIRRILLICFLALLIAAAGALYWSHALVQQPLRTVDDSALFEVQRGAHARSILTQLAERGWLEQPDIRLNYLASRLWSAPEGLQAGVYQIHNGQSLQDVWQQLRAGEQHQFTVTLIEGQTLAQWLQVLLQHTYIDTDLVATSADSPALIEAVTGSQALRSLEGFLAPDTYHFYAGTEALELLRKAYQTQQLRLAEAWQQRAEDLPYTDSYELLIMASIIEKETGLGNERDLVSSVFVNRLRKGMRLQSDPTTIYGITDFDGNLTRAHLRATTAYNTYRIDGLPPTPIAMPGRASLHAAAEPATSNYYYFVADGSGGHVFSETLAEHNRAVNRYQRGKN
ncbi:endolytic transglycosylase MltG [Pseudidiomarina terrestris]|uniref:endolytic transglycosylase MltG n=1 Tax=Pseudidiomarina terrestris TaxID=2820060 RepID=UPI00265AAB13|nr:endolytic transglycosylase MltG [Pseudidiomarina sp. 1APR75-33.1]